MYGSDAVTTSYTTTKLALNSFILTTDTYIERTIYIYLYHFAVNNKLLSLLPRLTEMYCVKIFHSTLLSEKCITFLFLLFYHFTKRVFLKIINS